MIFGKNEKPGDRIRKIIPATSGCFFWEDRLPFMSTFLLDADEGLKNAPLKLPEMLPEGLFGPDSIAWKVNREQVTLLAGRAAAVLQVAHPGVAKGLAKFGECKAASGACMKRAFSSIQTITFGTRRDVLEVVQPVQRMLARRRSEESDRNGLYSVLDEDLQLWVLATLVKGAVVAYEQFVGSLSADEKEAYFQDMRVWGEFFGLSRSYGPKNWGEFESYYNYMVCGGLLGSDSRCVEMARGVLYPEISFLSKMKSRSLSFLVIEMIPARLLERLGLQSKRWTKAAWAITKAVAPPVYSIFPQVWRYPSEYRRVQGVWPESRMKCAVEK